MKYTRILSWILIGVVFIGTGYYIYQDISSRQYNENEEPVKEQANKSELEQIKDQLKKDLGIEGENYDIEVIPTDNVMPDLDRLVIDDSFSDEAKEIMVKKLTDTSNFLKDDPSSFVLWLDLGVQRKIANDYEGARDVWEYLNVASPQNSISFTNLGDLYGYYLKDYEKAEENFLIALKNDPSEISLYFRISSFYRDIYKDLDKARNVVKQGISVNPESQELKDLLESLSS